MAAMQVAARKQRREGVKLIAVGVVFLLLGVFLLVVSNFWMGIIGVVFGIMGITTGSAQVMGGTSPAARIMTIIGCAAFALVGAFSLLAGIIAPAVFGWRGGASGIVAGAISLAFFGPGTVVLILREIKMRKRKSPVL